MMSRMSTHIHLSYAGIGEYRYTTANGDLLRIVKGWCLVDEGRKGAIMGRWYIASPDLRERLGEASGYLRLREVRAYLAAFESQETHSILPPHRV